MIFLFQPDQQQTRRAKINSKPDTSGQFTPQLIPYKQTKIKTLKLQLNFVIFIILLSYLLGTIYYNTEPSHAFAFPLLSQAPIRLSYSTVSFTMFKRINSRKFVHLISAIQWPLFPPKESKSRRVKARLEKFKYATLV